MERAPSAREKNPVPVTPAICDCRKKSWIFAPYVFIATINFRWDTVDPVFGTGLPHSGLLQKPGEWEEEGGISSWQ